ncbi:MAG: M23 family metallopeptidase [Pseudomonadota bacterium]
MKKSRKIVYIAILLVILLFLSLGWFFMVVFEGERPVVSLQPLTPFLASGQKFTLNISDRKRGLRTLRLSMEQEGKEIPILQEPFPFKGFLNREGVHRYEKEVLVDPGTLRLAQGRADLVVSVWDYSRRSGGDGNLTVIRHKIIVDSIPPAIRTISRMHNVNRGGVGLVIYQLSPDARESGVFVNDLFFPGFPGGEDKSKGVNLCYYAIPRDSGPKPNLTLWAKDEAGNEAKAPFYSHIRERRFRKEKMTITDNFLSSVLPYFSFYPSSPEDSGIKKFLKINRDLRKENHNTLVKLKDKTVPKMLWEGTWTRLENAANMARFGDHRSYFYKGEKVDEQDHLGVDLASLVHSPVQAANHGRVIFTEKLGIYGLTVVLDHGQGLASFYGHLSKIEVPVDKEVKKGDVIGATGHTGLAGGDHLHFSIMLSGVFVNPLEWWDPHWIKDNVTKKLALIQ